MVTIKEFTNAYEAGAFQSFLEENSIDAVLTDVPSAASSGTTLAPIRLQVPEAQADTAISLVKQLQDLM